MSTIITVGVIITGNFVLVGILVVFTINRNIPQFYLINYMVALGGPWVTKREKCYCYHPVNSSKVVMGDL